MVKDWMIYSWRPGLVFIHKTIEIKGMQGNFLQSLERPLDSLQSLPEHSQAFGKVLMSHSDSYKVIIPQKGRRNMRYLP